jgi:hypothetical protein
MVIQGVMTMAGGEQRGRNDRLAGIGPGQNQKKGGCKPPIFLVGTKRFELLTPTVSRL